MSKLPQLVTNDILGIIQRQLAELNAYLSQPPNLVDPAIVMAYLERSASFTQQLPSIRKPQAANEGEAKAN